MGSRLIYCALMHNAINGAQGVDHDVRDVDHGHREVRGCRDLHEEHERDAQVQRSQPVSL